VPYIKKEQRKDLDVIIKLMVEKGIKADGDLNFILYKFCKYHVEKNYNSLKNYLGELNEAAEEIRRRILVPYEKKKQKINGEI